MSKEIDLVTKTLKKEKEKKRLRDTKQQQKKLKNIN